MHIESVTVGLSLTESLPDYCNVRPSLNVTARLEPGEDVAAVVAALDAQVRAYVEGQVDDALEASDRPPKYYQGQRCQLYLWQQRHALVILPANVAVRDLPGKWVARSVEVRPATARRLAAQEATEHGYQVLDCPQVADLLAWWEAQTFYVAYGLVVWRDHHDWDVARTLFIRHDLERPQGLRRIDDTLRTLEDYTTRRFPELGEWTTVDEQAILDLLVANWLETHPKPEPIIHVQDF